MRTPFLPVHVLAAFKAFVEPEFAGSPCQYLELGVYKGGTAHWMLSNVLTHEDAFADLVDIWEPYEAEPDRHGNPRIYSELIVADAYRRAAAVREAFREKCRLHKMSTREYLAGCQKTYDLVFVDASHARQDVLADAVAATELLSDGGWLLFDDTNLPDVLAAVGDWKATASVTRDVSRVFATGKMQGFAVYRKQDDDEMKFYRGHRTWFQTRAKANFEEHLVPRYAGKPCRYLEIGVWRGDSLVWMMAAVLTHWKSRAWAVDPWLPLRRHPTLPPMWTAEDMESHFLRARKRLRQFGKRCKLVRSMSSVWLRHVNLPPHWFDIVYIDGDHYGPALLDDIVLTWPLLKIGGVLVIDDYRTARKKQHQVRETVDAVMETVYGQYVERLFCNWQVGYLKTGDVTLTTSPDDKSEPYGSIQTKLRT